MPELASRPAGALRELEELQQRERRGAEGDDSVWRGHGASMQEAVAHRMMADAMKAIPDSAVPEDVWSISREWIEQAVAATPPNLPDEAQQAAEDVRQRSAMTRNPDQWSRFEHPVASDILMDIVARIEGTITDFGRPRRRQSIPTRILAADLPWSLSDKHRPAVGTLSTGQFVASSQRAKDGGIVILVENGLFPLAHSLAQVGVLGFQESTDDGRLSEPTVQSISDVAASHLALGHLLGLPVRSTPPAMRPHVAAVEDAILVFVLAHEYAHILNGDLAAHALGGPAGGTRGDPAREYLADVAGLRITLATATRYPQLAGAALWGPLLFLAGLDVLVRADAAVRREAPVTENDPGGPTPFERVNNLIGAVAQSELIGSYEDALRAGLGAFNAVLFAWDIVMPAIWEMSGELAGFSDGEPASGYQAEMDQWAAAAMLWANVKPRIAAQQRIPKR